MLEQLEKPFEVGGHAQDCYRIANDVFMDYTRKKAEGKDDLALEQLFVVNRFLEKAELDLERRNGYSSSTKIMPKEEDKSYR